MADTSDSANLIPRRVLVLFTNEQQASYRLRIAGLAEPLLARGIELIPRRIPADLIGRLRLLYSSTDYDAVILQRRLLSVTLLRLLRHRAARLIYDVDDALWEPNRPLGTLAERRTRGRFEAIARLADHIAAGSEHLARAFRSRGTDATLVPTVVCPHDYRLKDYVETATPRLVWIGSRSTLPYLESLRPVLAEASRRLPGLELVTIADATLNAPPLPVQHIPWSADSEADALVAGDIGIAPTPDDPFTRGKCGFKVLQYMAAGLPTVVSPVGANAEIVLDGETGFHARTESDWIDRIVELAGDQARRSRFGTAGRQRVETNYSIDVAVDRWVSILK